MTAAAAPARTFRDLASCLKDPLALARWLWPHVAFYREQQDIIRSVVTNRETYVPAANKMGKDFTAGFIVLWFFLTRRPCRIVTTSAKDDHLRVLWGEIGRFIDTAAVPLKADAGGPLIVNHQELKKLVASARPSPSDDMDGSQSASQDRIRCPISYVKGLVASPDRIAAMQGHHANPTDIGEANDLLPRTLFVVDEASSIPDDYMTMARTWANRILVIGNTWPCENFWKSAIRGRSDGSQRGGDLPAPDGTYYRRVIQIKAAQSPNVRLALAQIEAGRSPSGRLVVPGVKTWQEYDRDRRTLDKIAQCVSLDAEFYEGSEVRLFPAQWLDAAAHHAQALRGVPRRAKAMGIDPGEGVANSSWCIIDERGIIELVSMKTPDTSRIPSKTLELMIKHQVPAHKIYFDRGGGGKQHADRLRDMGYGVQTVAFGESLLFDPKRGKRLFPEKVENREERYAYVNRRAEMYGKLRIMLDPANGINFAIPAEYGNLRCELSPIPLTYDEEGRLELLPKNEPDIRAENSKPKLTLTKLIGHSPDEADALALAIYALTHKGARMTAGVPD